MSSHTFSAKERLKSQKVISKLFKGGKSFGAYPLRLIWVPLEDTDHEFPIQITFTVPKRAFPKAAHRNRIKRQIREAYRLQKFRLYESLDSTDKQYGLMILFVAKEPVTYASIEKAVQKMFKTFLYKIR